MGGVYVTNHDTAGKIAEFIGLDGVHSYSGLEAVLGKSLSDYTRGLISEDELWRIFTEKTGKSVDNNPSIFGRFFAPIINPETDKVIRELKADGMRVVCGTSASYAERMSLMSTMITIMHIHSTLFSIKSIHRI